MTYVRKTVRSRPLGASADLEEVRELINRELVETVIELRREVNRLGGDVRTVDSDEVLARTDRIVQCDASAAAVTLTLPPAADFEDQRLTIVAVTVPLGITVAAQAGETIVGASSYTSLVGQYDTVELFSDGVEWFILAERL